MLLLGWRTVRRRPLCVLLLIRLEMCVVMVGGAASVLWVGVRVGVALDSEWGGMAHLVRLAGESDSSPGTFAGDLAGVCDAMSFQLARELPR